MFCYNCRHQIRKGFTSSNLCFTEGYLLFGETDIHLLRKSNLFLADVISVVGKYNSENGIDDLHWIINEGIKVSHIAGILHGIEDVRDELSVGSLGIKIAGLLCDHSRRVTGL